MTTFEKTWTNINNYDVDNTDTEGTRRMFIWKLYDMLTSAGTGQWTVVKSCDGVTASDDDAQAWTDVSKVVFGDSGTPVADGTIGNGTAHSWIELKSPDDFPTAEAGNLYVLIDCATYDNTYETGYYYTIYVGRETALAGGTTLHRPPLTIGSWWSWSSYNYNGYSTYLGTPATTNTNGLRGIPPCFEYDAAHISYFHGSRAEDGSFFYYASQEGVGYAGGGGWLMKIDTPRSEVTDPYPITAAFGWKSSTPGFFLAPGTVNSTSGLSLGYTTSNALMCQGTPNEDGNFEAIYSGGGDRGRGGCGVATLANADVGYPMQYQNQLGYVGDGRLMAAPIYIVQSGEVTNYRNDRGGIRGRVQDIRVAPYGSDAPSVVQGTVEPSVGSPQSVIIGNYWFPCDAGPIL